MRRWLITGVLAAAWLVAPPAQADDAPKKSKLVPAVTAVFPGVLLHGTGQFMLGEKTAYARLAGAELVGLAVGGAGALTFWFTGAARGLATGATAATLLGGSWVVLTWLADLYGALVCEENKGDVLRTVPILEAEASTVYAAGPALAPSLRVGTAVTTRLGPMGLHLGTSVAPATRYDRVEATILYRPFGATPGNPTSGGSTFDLGVTRAHTRHGTLGFDVGTVDLFASGRLDLASVGRSLRGSFAELSGGVAVRTLAFDHGATSARPDMALLFRTAFGVAIGHFGAPFRGEAKVYYDHRHDDDAGSLLGNGRVSGVFSHVGVEGLVLTRSGWGARAYGEVGSAGVVGLSLLYRVGGLR